MSTAQRALDINDKSTCVDILKALHNQYLNVITGNVRVVVRFHERWSEYQRADVEQIRLAYQTIYSQCPTAAREGLPDLSPGARARRGGPARNLQIFPRQ